MGMMKKREEQMNRRTDEQGTEEGRESQGRFNPEHREWCRKGWIKGH
jgi:hypothetical protein